MNRCQHCYMMLHSTSIGLCSRCTLLPRSVILKTAADLHPNHLWYNCKCGGASCQFCAGGLASCVICGGFEGTLTTDCPGIEMNKYIQEAVYKGGLDFKDGAWMVKDIRCTTYLSGEEK